MQDSPVVQYVAILYVELKHKNNQGKFLLKYSGICRARNLNTCAFISMLFQSLEVINYLQYAAINLMRSVNLIQIFK